MRPADSARFALGVLALTRPGLPVRVSGSHDGVGVRRTVRILGTRYVVQSLGGSWLHRAWVPGADALVDLVHAASMLAVARALPRHRRLALTSATLAAGFATADLIGLRDPMSTRAAGRLRVLGGRKDR